MYISAGLLGPFCTPAPGFFLSRFFHLQNREKAICESTDVRIVYKRKIYARQDERRYDIHGYLCDSLALGILKTVRKLIESNLI